MSVADVGAADVHGGEPGGRSGHAHP